MEHANNILLILAVNSSDLEFTSEDIEDVNCMAESEWEDVRDDSLVHLLMKESNVSEINGGLSLMNQMKKTWMQVTL